LEKNWLTPLLAAVAIIWASACGSARLTVDPDVLAAAPPELLQLVRADPYNYFRLTNREWTARTCALYAADLADQPIVQLHGDAHVEQYASMQDAWGLDDFDDSARGPAFVDIVRFLGSIELAAWGRGWSRDRDRLFDQFFAGYRRGLSDPSYQPAEPDVVRRIRADQSGRDTFFSWAESKMEPMSAPAMSGIVASLKAFGDALRAERPDVRVGYFTVVRAGLLRMGVGSAGPRKMLIRVEGPSSDPADDVLLEAKAVRARDGLPCIEQPRIGPTVRIIKGSQQVGRLRHEILVAGPELAIPEMAIQGEHLRDWWIRSWDASYQEIARADLQSVQDLSDIVYDSGVQLGGGTLHGVAPPDDGALRTRLVAYLDRREPQLRRTAVQIIEELLRGWRAIGER
jgi:hypothetical protein